MESAAQELEELLNNVHFSEPNATLISNVTGEIITEFDSIKPLLLRQLTSTVHWLGCMNTVKKRNLPVVEMGPGNVLSTLMKRHGISDVSFFSGVTS